MNSKAQLARREAALAETTAVIRVNVIEDDEVFVAQSPDLHGLIVTAYKLDALFKAVPDAIVKHYRARDLRVIVVRAQADMPGYTTFIAMPVAVAENALRHRADLL